MKELDTKHQKIVVDYSQEILDFISKTVPESEKYPISDIMLNSIMISLIKIAHFRFQDVKEQNTFINDLQLAVRESFKRMNQRKESIS